MSLDKSIHKPNTYIPPVKEKTAIILTNETGFLGEWVNWYNTDININMMKNCIWTGKHHKMLSGPCLSSVSDKIG